MVSCWGEEDTRDRQEEASGWVNIVQSATGCSGERCFPAQSPSTATADLLHRFLEEIEEVLPQSSLLEHQLRLSNCVQV